MALRITVDPNTKEVSAPTSAEEPRRIYSGDSPVSVAATVKVNEPAFRASVDTETGAIKVQQNAPTSYRPETPAGQGGTVVRNSAGQPTTLSQAKPSDVIDFGPGRGDTTVQVALSLGWIVPSAAGGYMLPGGQQPAEEQQPKDEQAQQQDSAPVNPADVRGVEGTSAQSDATLQALQTHAPAQLEHLIDSIGAKGVIPDFDEVSQMLGDENAGAKIAQLHSEQIRAGQTVLKNVDASINPEAFEAWVRRTNPDFASTIVRDMLVHHSAASLAQAARSYVKARDNALATRLDGMGIETQRRDGVLYISREAVGLQPTPRRGDFGGETFISVAEAEKLGLLTINEG
jgi:hypothetical protein